VHTFLLDIDIDIGSTIRIKYGRILTGVSGAKPWIPISGLLKILPENRNNTTKLVH